MIATKPRLNSSMLVRGNLRPRRVMSGAPAGLRGTKSFWFDATQMSDGAGGITTMPDLTGIVGDLTSAGGTIFELAGLNGKKCILFSADDQFELANVPFDTIFSGDQYMVQAVFQRNSTGAVDGLFSWGDPTSGFSNACFAGFGTSLIWDTAEQFTGRVSANVLTGTDPIVLTLARSGTNRFATVNGVSVIDTTSGDVALQLVRTFMIGARRGVDQFTGRIGEFVCFSDCPSREDIAFNDAFLMNKWSIL